MGNYLQGQRKTPTQRKYVFNQVSLNNASPTILGGAAPFPFGQIYKTMFLEFYLTLANTTGTGAIAEGELSIVKNILIKTDKHDILVNASGRSLFYRARKVMRTTPYKDAIAVTAKTYKISIPIHFSNKQLRRPDDTGLDTAGVSSLDLQVTMGDVGDLLGSVGDAVVTCKLNVTVEKTLYGADASNMPIMQSYIVDLPPVDTASLQYFELEKTMSLGLLDIMAFTTDAALAGSKFSGTPANDVVASWNFEDNIRQVFQNITGDNIQFDNKDEYELETLPTGQYIFTFAKDKSVWSAYPVGGKSRVQLNWINGANVTTPLQVTALIDGVKTLNK